MYLQVVGEEEGKERASDELERGRQWQKPAISDSEQFNDGLMNKTLVKTLCYNKFQGLFKQTVLLNVGSFYPLELLI